MAAKLEVSIGAGIMPRGGGLKKPLQLLMDEDPVADLDWGEERQVAIPAGRHTLALKTNWGGLSNTLRVDLVDGESAQIKGALDVKSGAISLVNPAEVDRAEAAASRKREAAEAKGKVVQLWAAVGAAVGLALGAGLAYVLNTYARGVLPGGLAGLGLGVAALGALGAGFGALVGVGLNMGK